VDIDNPYSPPTAKIDDKVGATGGMEQIRQKNIRHEVQLKSIGSLYGLAGILLGISSIAMLVTLFGSDSNMSAEQSPMFAGILAFYGVLSAIMLAMAYGYRQLMPWVKIPGTVLSAFGMLGIPVGTLINGYILYLIWCKQGQTILADGYQDIIRATPHVKYKRTLGDKIALGIVIAMLVGVAILIFVSISQ
jgi:hypothetical protein